MFKLTESVRIKQNGLIGQVRSINEDASGVKYLVSYATITGIIITGIFVERELEKSGELLTEG